MAQQQQQHTTTTTSSPPPSTPSATTIPPDPTPYLSPSFSTFLTTLLAKTHVPGFSVAVISGSRIHASGYGTARFPSTPATAKTLYPMCSTTKAFTAALLGICVEEAEKLPSGEDEGEGKGNLHLLREKGWQTPVSKILPRDFVSTSPFVTRHATLEDLASHRSGITGHDFLWGPWMGRDLAVATRSYRHLEPVREGDFRVAWQYSNLAYATMGQVVEVVLGGDKGYAEVLRERVLGRLGMVRTWMGVEGARDGLLGDDGGKEGWMEEWARPYFWRKVEGESEGEGQGKERQDEKGHYMPEPHMSLRGMEPGGALVSSVEDYAKWARALLDAARRSRDAQGSDKEKQERAANDSDNPISPSLYRTLTSPRISFARPFPNPSVPPSASPHLNQPSYALGWMLERGLLPGHTIVCHGGGLPGIGTLVALLPDHDFAIVCAGNSDASAEVCEAVCKELMGRRVGLGEEERRWRKEEDKEEGKKVEQGDMEPPVAPADGARDWETEAAGRIETHDVDVDLKGKWNHPAYGTFLLSRAGAAAAVGKKDSSLDGVDIVRYKKDTVQGGSQKEPWLITPLGRRSLHYRFLLHPRSQPSKTANELGLVLFDQEEISAHGDIGEDVFPELDRGWPVDEDGKEVRGAVWGAHGGLKKGGAIAERTDVGKGGKGGAKVRRLGLTLWRRMVGQGGKGKGEGDDVLGTEWEDERIWFTSVDEK